MAWVKLDDQFADHPKVIEAGPLAAWLYVCGLTYCSRLLTDGFIPAGQIRRLADVKNPDALAKRLVAVGLWEACDGGYRIHDYFEYQPTRERVLATRAVRSDAGSLGGKRRASNAQANGKQDASKLLEPNLPVASSEIQPRPVPAQPRCLESNVGENARERATPPLPLATNVRSFVPNAGMTQLPRDWKPSDEDQAYARKFGLTDDQIMIADELFRQHQWEHGNGSADWGASWRKWMVREVKGGPGAPRLPPLSERDLPPMTEEERAADAANRAELERKRQEYLAKQPSAAERLLQKARDDPDRPHYVDAETWMTWDSGMKRANSPQMRARLAKTKERR